MEKKAGARLGIEQSEESCDMQWPQFMQDLYLDQVVTYITRYFKKYHLEEYYNILPDKKGKLKRQAMIDDLLMNEQLYDSMKALLAASEVIQKQRALEKNCKYQYQSMKLYVDNCTLYYKVLRDLEQCLCQEKVKSIGFKELANWMKQEFFQDESTQLEKAVNEVNELFQEIDFTVCFNFEKNITRSRLINNKKHDTVRILISERAKENESQSKQYYLEKIARMLRISFEQVGDGIPFHDEKEINELERNILMILSKYKKKPFEYLEKLCKHKAEYYKDAFHQLLTECAFYVSYIEFVRTIQKEGHIMSIPKEQEDSFGVVNGYDLALVIQSMEEGNKVISNSCEYQKKEKFFVITGANKGGKTTFARMLGQVVYFAQMGLMIPASYACIPNFDGIYSHFAKDEAKEVGAGKLKEELIRLAPIMDEIKKEKEKRIFLVINELFTTAATYDAVLMGHKVIDFLCMNDCFGVYVTHVRELAQGKEEMASLVAEVRDDELRTRTYKITRNESESGQVKSLAYRYGLTYEQMRKRVSRV